MRVDENGLLVGGCPKAAPDRSLLCPDRAVEHLAQVALGDRLAAGRKAEGRDLGLAIGG